jgi:flavin reductase (DIM6/NTAB) family NADH-FMN oxidoreductase RutF
MVTTLESKGSRIKDLRDFWKLMSPRLTVLVTTMDIRGKSDVSPFSFVTPVSFDPPLLMLAVGTNTHSYKNLMAKKEFVVNIPTERLLEKIWTAGEGFDSEVSKIERAGLETAPSSIVGPPRLTECVVNIECYLEDAKKIGDHIMIVGKVIAVHANEEYVDSEGRLKVDLVRPPMHVADDLFAFHYVTKKV